MPALIKLSAPARREFWEVPILWEDEHLLAVDKPAGLLTSPDRYDPERPNLMKLLHQEITRGAGWVQQHQITYLSNAHRLDFETSGVLLLAKTKPALVSLADQFGSERPAKTYLALSQGTPAEATFTVDVRLSPHPVKPWIIRVQKKEGKTAVTHFEVAERFVGYTLIRCRPQTGRTHQIRVHLQHSGLPIVGDANYGGQPLLLSRLKPVYRLRGGKTERPLIGRTALHAAGLIVRHPVTGDDVKITSPWPRDLLVAVKYLRRYAPIGGTSEAGNGIEMDQNLGSDDE